MIKKHLGDTIDLHTGGVDLLFPHHENEIAQSQCCNGTTFARHWYHSEHLLVDGTTMSKSKGNYYTLSDLVEKGYSPMAVRYALLMGHPRKQLNFTLDSLHAAERALKTLRSFHSDLKANSTKASSVDQNAQTFDSIFKTLGEDLNTPQALGILFGLVNSIDTKFLGAEAYMQFTRVVFALGLDLTEPVSPKADIPSAITDLAEKRWAAKQAKDFATADALRKELTAAGWSMLDSKTDYKLEPLKK
jgi:cysteinyl-tRNA synthetase